MGVEVYANGTATIRQKGTGKAFDIDADELSWECVGSEERQMGHENHYAASVEHPQLGKLTWGIWEYPVGIENMTKTDVGEHTVVTDFDYGLEHTPDED
jgi:hypothetical protein